MSSRPWLTCAVLCCAACGLSGSPTGAGGSSAAITIQDFAFSPQNLDVMPGEVVTVRNLDTTPHSVTSESAPGQFSHGGVNGVSFDTGVFSGDGSFTVPASAAHGTVVPYYCTVHLGGMRNTGQITVR